MIKDHAAVLDALGGTGKVAAKRGLPLGTVSAWKTRNAIPAAHWWGISQMAVEMGVEGVTVDALAEMAGNRERKGAAA